LTEPCVFLEQFIFETHLLWVETITILDTVRFRSAITEDEKWKHICISIA